MPGGCCGRSPAVPHQVHTAVVAWRISPVRHDHRHHRRHRVDLDDETIDWYLATGEYRDKAGAYGIQGAAGALVERADGSPTNVIGLPLADRRPSLARAPASPAARALALSGRGC